MFDAIMARNRVRGILKILEEERRIILDGSFSDLARNEPHREKLIDGLTNGKWMLTEEDVTRIRRAADRNRVLLEASISGAQAAKATILAASVDAKTFGTYTNSGERVEIIAAQDRSLNLG